MAITHYKWNGRLTDIAYVFFPTKD